MIQKVPNTLGKNERLKSRKVIDALFNEGKSLSVFPFKIIYQINNAGHVGINSQHTSLQCAFSVSKRRCKLATSRNRIKRLMREAWRLQKNEWQQQLHRSNKQAIVFLLYVGNELPDYKLVLTKINTAIKKLQAMGNENA